MKPQKFGEIAVAQQFITQEQLERALSEQPKHGLRIGELLVKMGFLTSAQNAAICKFQDVLVNKVSDDPLIGSIKGGCLILEELGRGAVGITYKAHHLNLDREVALKVLSQESLANDTVVERFRQEARAIARLNHPSIVSVYDFNDEVKFPFIVMEFVEGKSLRSMLEEQGQLAPKAAVWTALKLTAALAAAHDQGIVHRDLKPENVLISDKREVKLADFGIVRMLNDRKDKSNTHYSDAEVLGTPQYMSPEQARSQKDIDHRADYYSLGIMLFELISGQLPYQQKEIMPLLRAQMNEPLPDLRRLCPYCPSELAALITELTVKDRDRRLVDPSLITARLHDLVSQWASLPAMFPNVTGRTGRLGGREQLEEAIDLSLWLERALNGDVRAALDELILRKAPETHDAAMGLLESLWDQNRIDDILSLRPEFAVAVALNERSHFLIAQALRKQRLFEEAVLSLKSALLLTTDRPRLTFELARVYLESKQKSMAVAVVNELMYQNPHNGTIIERIGEFLYTEINDPEAAVDAYKKALEHHTERWPLLQKLGWIQLESKNFPAAVPFLEEASKIAPQPAFPLKLLAQAYNSMQRVREAEECFTHSLKLDPDDLDTRLELIRMLKRMNRYKEVISLCKRGLLRHEDDLTLSLVQAESQMALGMPDKARRTYRKILEKHPNSKKAKEGMVSAQRARRQPKR